MAGIRNFDDVIIGGDPTNRGQRPERTSLLPTPYEIPPFYLLRGEDAQEKRTAIGRVITSRRMRELQELMKTGDTSRSEIINHIAPAFDEEAGTFDFGMTAQSLTQLASSVRTRQFYREIGEDASIPEQFAYEYGQKFSSYLAGTLAFAIGASREGLAQMAGMMSPVGRGAFVNALNEAQDDTIFAPFRRGLSQEVRDEFAAGIAEQSGAFGSALSMGTILNPTDLETQYALSEGLHSTTVGLLTGVASTIAAYVTLARGVGNTTVARGGARAEAARAIGLSGRPAKAFMRSLSQTGKTTRGAAIAKVSAATIGGGMGWYLTPEDAPTMQRVLNAAAGVGLATTIPSFFARQPWTVTARALHAETLRAGAAQAAGRGAGAVARGRALGAHILFNERATVGHMLSVGGAFGAIGAGQTFAETGDLMTSLQAGLFEAGTSMFADGVLFRMGSSAKWVDYATRYDQAAAGWIQHIAQTAAANTAGGALARTLGGTSRRAGAFGAATQIATDTAAATALNAAILGEDTTAGTIFGTSLLFRTGRKMNDRFGQVAARETFNINQSLAVRLQSLLPARIIKKIESGTLDQVKRDEAELLAAVAAREAVETAAGTVDDAADKHILRRSVGRLEMSDAERTQAALAKAERIAMLANDPLEINTTNIVDRLLANGGRSLEMEAAAALKAQRREAATAVWSAPRGRVVRVGTILQHNGNPEVVVRRLAKRNAPGRSVDDPDLFQAARVMDDGSVTPLGPERVNLRRAQLDAEATVPAPVIDAVERAPTKPRPTKKTGKRIDEPWRPSKQIGTGTPAHVQTIPAIPQPWIGGGFQSVKHLVGTFNSITDKLDELVAAIPALDGGVRPAVERVIDEIADLADRTLPDSLFSASPRALPRIRYRVTRLVKALNGLIELNNAGLIDQTPTQQIEQIFRNHHVGTAAIEMLDELRTAKALNRVLRQRAKKAGDTERLAALEVEQRGINRLLREDKPRRVPDRGEVGAGSNVPTEILGKSVISRGAQRIPPTRQGMNSPGAGMVEINAGLRPHGAQIVNVERAAGLPRGYRLESTVDGKVFFEGNSLEEAVRQAQSFIKQRGAARTSLLIGGGAAVAGGFLGPFVLDPLYDSIVGDFGKDTAGQNIMEAALGSALLGIGSLVAGARMTRGAPLGGRSGARFYNPGAIGRPTTKVARGYMRDKALKESVFLGLPLDLQHEYFERHLKRIMNNRSKSNQSKIDKLDLFIRTYMPIGPVPPRDLNSTLELIRDAALKIMPDDEALAFTRGAFARMATIPRDRQIRKMVAVDLVALGRNAQRVGEAGDWNALKGMVRSAEILTGPIAKSPSSWRGAIRKNLSKAIHPETDDFITLVNDLERSGIGLSQTALGKTLPETRVLPLLGATGLSPSQYLLNQSRALIEAGDTNGFAIQSYVQSAHGTADTIRERTVDEIALLRRNFAGLNAEQLKSIRPLLSEPGRARLHAMPADDAVRLAAEGFDDQLKRLAIDTLGQLQFDAIKLEDYFPLFYTLETLEKLKKMEPEARAEAMYVGMSVNGIPDTPTARAMGNFIMRGGGALGEAIEDPLEAGTMYIIGAIRKKHLDALGQQFRPGFFSQVAQNGQPALANSMRKIHLDLFGLPSQQAKRMAGELQNWGLDFEDLAVKLGANDHRLLETLARRFGDAAMNPASLQKFTNFLRGAEFYMKIGFNWTSSMVNLSQAWINGLTDLRVADLFYGAGFLTSGVAQRVASSEKLGKIARGAGLNGWDNLAPWINLKFDGQRKMDMLRKFGVFSSQSRRQLDKLDLADALHDKTTAGKILFGTVAGGTTGAWADAAFGDDPGTTIGGVAGTAIGIAAAIKAPRAIGHSLYYTKMAATGLFDTAEAINRGVVGGAATRAARRTQAYSDDLAAASGDRSAKAAVKDAMRREEILDSTIVGAMAGGALGGAAAEDGSKLEGAALGAAVGGAALGGGIGRFGSLQADRDLTRLRNATESIPNTANLRPGMMPTDPVTAADVEQFFARQIVEETQFRMSREARPSALRTPVGEVVGSLQSFTLNQIEFVGERFGRMMNDLSDGKPVDSRFVRHIALLTGTAAVYHGLFGGILGDDNSSPAYWGARIGLGFLPWLEYDKRTDSWGTVTGDQFFGPVVSDIVRTANTIVHLATDARANRSFLEQLDDLSRDLFTVFRSIETGSDQIIAPLGDHLSNLGSDWQAGTDSGVAALAGGAAEAIGGLMADQRQRMGRFAENPVSSTMQNRPGRKPGPRRALAGSRGGGGFSNNTGFSSGGGF